MTVFDFDNWLVEQARTMPRAMNKGGTSLAQENVTNADNASSSLLQQGQAEQAQVLPFLQSEMNNPQGFGQQGTNELMTAGGQATSGAVGGANEAAQLRASRSGNPSSSASIIDAAARGGAQQQSNNALGIDTANLQQKEAQQQAGAQGISALSGGNIGESLSALGLSNQAVQDYTNAYTKTDWQSSLGAVAGAAGKLL
jgi:hypothetical protein